MKSLRLLRGAAALAPAWAFLWLALAGAGPAAAQEQEQEEAYLDRVLALAGDEAILYSEFTQRLQEVRENLERREQGAPAQSVLEREVLERMIVESLQLQIGKRVGVEISDQDLDRAMESAAEEKDLSLEEWRRQMVREGTYRNYRERLRRELVIDQVQRGNVRRKVRIEDREIDRFLKSREGAALYEPLYRMLHVMAPLEPEAAAAEKRRARRCLQRIRKETETEEDFMRLAAADEGCALRSGDLGRRPLREMPTLFEEPVQKLQVGEITPVLSNDSGLHLGYLAERSGGTEQFVEQRKVRHILLRDEEHSERNRAKLEDIRDDILEGEDFGIMAGNYSEDPGSATEGGSLGWVSPGEMTPKFEEVMNRVDIDAVSPVFSTPYGWHILQVSDKRSKNIAEEKIRDRAHRVLYLRRYQEELRDWLDKIRDEALVEVRW